ncbi:MAG: hypothetical protein GTO18_16355 [Anaerolineales bacterium]|nr:hypothetical protein [Anaerolineales bacterium]
MTAKPVVDALEKEYAEDVAVIHINIQEPAGQRLGPRFRFEYTPTFIILDGEGNEVWRMVGIIDPNEARRVLDGLK